MAFSTAANGAPILRQWLKTGLPAITAKQKV
jgi:hypothetical protein